MSFRLFSAGRGSDPFALIEIGSGSVQGALIAPGEEKPRILAATRVEMGAEDNPALSQFLERMSACLADAANQLLVRAQKDPHIDRVRDVYVVVASPWYAARTKILKLEQEKTFLFTQTMLSRLVNDEYEAYLAALRAEATEAIGQSPRLIEHAVIGLQLNGYQTTRPFGKRARRLQLSLYESAISEEMYRAITQTVQRSFHRLVAIQTFPLVTWTVLRSVEPTLHDYLLVEVGSEVTDVALSRQGVLRDTASFPIGVATLLRALAKKMKTSITEARSMMKLLTEGSLERARAEALTTLLMETRAQALGGLTGVCSQLGERLALPQELLLVCAPEYSRWFAETFSDAACAPFTTLNDPFHIRIFDGGFISSFIKNEVGGRVDPRLAIGSLYFSANRLSAEKARAILAV